MQSVNILENFLLYSSDDKDKTTLEADKHYNWVIAMLRAQGASIILELYEAERNHSQKEAIKLATVYCLELSMLINQLKRSIDAEVRAELERILEFVKETGEELNFKTKTDKIWI
nr:hypothetical protein [Pedobacter panaciterrae]